LSSENNTEKKPKEKKYKVGDKVKFYDEQNKEFNGVIEKINPNKTASIKVSRLIGHSQIYLSVPFSSNKKTKCRYN